MKRIVFMLVLILCSGICSAEDIQVIFATGEWAPFTSEHLPEYGAATALVTAICNAGGIQPVYKFYPWPRAEAMVADGDIFAAFPYVASEERAQNFDFSDVLFYGIEQFLFFSDNPKIRGSTPYNSLEDLRGYRIGIIRGGHQKERLEQVGIYYEETTMVEQSIRKLEAGRIDFYLDNTVVSYDVITQIFPEKLDKFKTLPKSFGEKNSVVLIASRTYPEAQEILTRFNEGLSLIKQNGEYDRIVKKYHMMPVE